MAGFQKFPVPKYLYIDFWNYNKKWIGNTFYITLGSFLTFLSLNRYLQSRIVNEILFCREPMKELVTLLIHPTKSHLKSLSSEMLLIMNESFKLLLLMEFVIIWKFDKWYEWMKYSYLYFDIRKLRGLL